MEGEQQRKQAGGNWNRRELEQARTLTHECPAFCRICPHGLRAVTSVCVVLQVVLGQGLTGYTGLNSLLGGGSEKGRLWRR